MSDWEQYNEEQYQMLSVAVADTSVGICLFRADDPGRQIAIARRLQSESEKSCYVLNMAQVDDEELPDSIVKMQKLLKGHEDCKVVIICNLQLCGIGIGNVRYIQSLNYMRDQLLAMNKVWVFGMSDYFAVLLSRVARDIYSCIMNHFEFKEEPKEPLWIFEESEVTGDAKVLLLLFKQLQGDIQRIGIEKAGISELLDVVAVWNSVYQYCTRDTNLWIEKILRRLDKEMPRSGLTARTAMEYRTLWSAYSYMGKQEDALKIALAIKAQMEKVWSGQSEEIATLNHDLGLIYVVLKDYDKAEDYLNQAIVYYVESGRKYYYKYFDVMDLLAQINSFRGNEDKAIDVYKNLIKLMEKTPRIKLEDVSRMWNNLGETYMRKYQYSNALHCFLKSEELLKESGSIKVRNMAITLNNIGLAYSELGDFYKGIRYLEESKALRRKIAEELI